MNVWFVYSTHISLVLLLHKIQFFELPSKSMASFLFYGNARLKSMNPVKVSHIFLHLVKQLKHLKVFLIFSEDMQHYEEIG